MTRKKKKLEEFPADLLLGDETPTYRSHQGYCVCIAYGGLSPAQESVLRTAVSQLGSEGLDWRSNVERELEILHRLDTQASAALARIIPEYLDVLDKPSTLPELEQMIGGAPEPLQKIIPVPRSLVEAKQDLSDKIQQIRTLLQ